MWAVETKQLSKSYGEVPSLVDCNLQIPPASVFGLLGPNGAGKSTLLRTLLGFLTPSSGTATIGGYDIRQQSQLACRLVSYLPGDARLMRSMRGIDLMRMFSGLHPCGSLPHSLSVAERLQLESRRRVMFMSTGMRQKLAIAIVLGCQAPVVVLDEPTANLDPNVRGEVVRLVTEVRQQGRTVVLSSHIFSDIDEACDRVAILREGRVVAEQTLSELQQSHIITARWAGQNWDRRTDDDGWRQPFMGQPLVSYLQSHIAAEGARQIELHLTGQPQLWLAWLAQLPLTNLNIERGGIRSIYGRYHQSAHDQ